METFPEQWLAFLDGSTSPIGLLVESLLLIIISAVMISLSKASRGHIHEKDLKRASNSFTIIIFLNIISIVLTIFQSTQVLLFTEHFYQAFHQFIWSINLIVVGWLWIKPSQQTHYSIFKMIFICASLGFFILEVGQVVEFIFQPSEISVPYTIIWKTFQYIVCFFLFFVNFGNTGNLFWSGLLFTLLHIVGLGLDSITNLPQSFNQNIAQLVAFLLSSHTLLAISIDPAAMEQRSSDIPIIFSENVAAIPNAEIIQSWLQADIQNEKHLLPFAFCKALARTFFADACLLIQINKPDQLKIQCGYSITADRQILPLQVSSLENIVVQQRSVIFHETDSFPGWVKAIIKKTNQSKTRSVWYVPIEIIPQKYYLLFLSCKVYWNEEHIAHFKRIQPYIAQFLWKYLGSNQQSPLSNKKADAKSDNPYIDLMQTVVDPSKDIEQLEEELKLALEEYNRIRNILEERGIGQQP
ncbi:MAG TPA: hypothetical protein DCK95_06440 [Anaerolineaceae bacterium]|uniref:Uncharacterized protein n=1 Tax=Anaerolinea thermophila TaxID=167964 RepID=A0A117LGW7_9CHLR|nr:MAG: hypothetical protein XD73_0660 [Anaerolinea thermophila]HAF61948.1 hypothetical protein [Anaerolineaceae bacterium]